jgi:hypothetical protein
VIGPPHWQIEAFQTFTIPEQLTAQHSYAQLTPEVKNKIFGENAARILISPRRAKRLKATCFTSYATTAIPCRPAQRPCEAGRISSSSRGLLNHGWDELLDCHSPSLGFPVTVRGCREIYCACLSWAFAPIYGPC